MTGSPVIIGIAGVAVLLAWILLLAQVDPVPTWFYVFAWYPTLVLADAWASRREGSLLLASDPRLVLSVLGWSAVVWLVFEAINFRLANWYYVFLPANRLERWAGILISFATVVPAVVLAERLLRSLGVGTRWRGREVRVRQWEMRAVTLLGAAVTVLALLEPRLFYPLIWGGVWLVVDPFVFRHRPEWSLLNDLRAGEFGRIGRLMLGGLAIGFLWEFYNAWARGKWIYTVPWLEQVKLFEMPPLGFIGFPFFALEAWSIYHALCVLRIARPLRRAGEKSTNAVPYSVVRMRGVTAVGVAGLFAVVALLGMERWTISSVVPTLADVPGITPEQVDDLHRVGIDSPFALASASSGTVDHRLIAAAQLTTLRGIGAEHAARLIELRIGTVCELAGTNAEVLFREYHEVATSNRPTAAEVRIWIRAAQEECFH